MALDVYMHEIVNNHICKEFDNSDEPKIARERFEKANEKFAKFKRDKKFSSGNRTAILCSSTDGEGNESKFDASWFVYAGLRYRVYMECMGRGVSVMENAGFDDLADVLSDGSIKNVVLIGHSSTSSWMASDYEVDCFDISEATRHLKKGFFAKIGCDIPEEIGRVSLLPQLGCYGFNVPLGYFAVSNRKRIYSGDEKSLTFEQLSSSENFVNDWDGKRNFGVELRQRRRFVPG